MPNIFNFTLIAIGALIFWALKGFKGKFNDEMVGPYTWNSKRMRNAIVGGVTILIVLAILGSV